jgi:uncharacterized membrane protein YkoI
MKTTFNITLAASLLSLAVACGGSHSTAAIGSPFQATALAERQLGGKAAYQAVHDGDHYVVEVDMKNGATVTATYDAQSGNIIALEDDQGPFDYSIDPGMGLLTYETARDKALAAVNATQVVAWNLRAPSTNTNSDSEPASAGTSQGEELRYEFYVRASSQLWEIKLDSKTGAIQSKEKKDAVD